MFGLLRVHIEGNEYVAEDLCCCKGYIAKCRYFFRVTLCYGNRSMLVAEIRKQSLNLVGRLCRRLSFKGLGEPITFITFGPLATSSFYLAHVTPPPLPPPSSLLTHTPSHLNCVWGNDSRVSMLTPLLPSKSSVL